MSILVNPLYILKTSINLLSPDMRHNYMDVQVLLKYCTNVFAYADNIMLVAQYQLI